MRKHDPSYAPLAHTKLIPFCCSHLDNETLPRSPHACELPYDHVGQHRCNCGRVWGYVEIPISVIEESREGNGQRSEM